MSHRQLRHGAAALTVAVLAVCSDSGPSGPGSAFASGTTADPSASSTSATHTSTAPPTTTGSSSTHTSTAPPTTTGISSTTTIGSTAATTESPRVDKRVFITAGTFHGDLQALGSGASGLEGADLLCAAAAVGASLGGVWVAWVSTSEVDAITRLGLDGRWTLIDGVTEVFASRGDLQFGPTHAIDVTEGGTALSDLGDVMVWTHSDRFGKEVTTGQTNACDDWTAQTGTANVGVVVDPEVAMGLSWTDTMQPRPCGDEYHLYCFEP